MTIERAHTLILKAGADTAKDLAHELRHIASQIDRGELTVGCIGGSSAGTLYSYRVAPEQTHDEYFRQINEMLERESARRPSEGGA